MRFLLLILLFLSGSVWAADIEADYVLLRGVDKVTGRTSTMEINIGESVVSGNLRITPERCLKKPPEETPENAAFLVIEEKNIHEAYEVIFSGWMFSSNPALSAMEHPVFDIWVIDCDTDNSVQKEWENMELIQTPVSQPDDILVESLDSLPISSETLFED